jgi:hypothetical protein
MANKPQKMKMREIRRAVTGVRSAGVDVGAVKVDPATGVVTVIVGKPGAPDTSANPWDHVNHAADEERTA